MIVAMTMTMMMMIFYFVCSMVLGDPNRLVDDHFSHCAHDGGVPGPSEILDLTQKDVLQMSFTVNDSKTQLFSKIKSFKGSHIMARKFRKKL